MIKGRILIIDDEKNVGFVVQTMLEKDGYEVILSQSSEAAIELLKEDDFDVILTDLYMPGPGGFEILKATKIYCPQVSVVIMTAFGTVDSAVQALKAGAFDFITKPFEKSELLDSISNAMKAARTNQAEPLNAHFQNQTYMTPRNENHIGMEVPSSEPSNDSDEYAFPLIGKSTLIDGLRKQLLRASDSQDAITFYGESGTGKELISRHLHFHSKRAEQPILKINCSFLSPEMLEMELFGIEGVYKKGGKLELAEGGTLILEDFSLAPHSIQERIYRYLRTGEFISHKSNFPKKSTARLHFLSEQSLDYHLNKGSLITELYFLLSPHEIHVPKLRDRIEDIELMVNFLLNFFSLKYKTGKKSLVPEFLTGFKMYDWPGNLTQLEKTLERLVLVSEGEVIQVTDLPEEILNRLDKSLMEPLISHAHLGLKEWVRIKTQQFEKEFIEKALEKTNGNVTKAAEVLKLSRKGLQLKLKELGIKRY